VVGTFTEIDSFTCRTELHNAHLSSLFSVIAGTVSHLLCISNSVTCK
jgi:hypothetical protein